MSGRIETTIIAGAIKSTGTPMSARIGQQVRMPGSDALIYITPEIAKQWISVLETIAEGSNA